MLSEVLSSFAEITGEIAEGEDYLLARVRSRGGEYVAEVVPADSPGAEVSWPEVDGVLASLASREIRGVRIRVFDLKDREVLAERLSRGPMEEQEALELALGLVPVLGRLASRNRLLGYLGPEGVLTDDEEPLILAGGRGCPAGPFTAPEAQGGSTGDPRSMVFALGTLIFRCIAGTDDRDRQVEVWKDLSPRTRSLLERAVGERPEERLPSVTIFGREIRRTLSGEEEPPPAREPRSAEAEERKTEEQAPVPPAETPPTGPEGFVRRSGYAASSGRRRRSFPTYLVAFAVIAAAAAAALLIVPGFLSGDGEGEAPSRETPALTEPEADSAGAEQPDPEPAPPPDSSAAPAEDSLPPPAGPSVIWVSNRAPEAGAEVDYRTGVLSEFSHVYPFGRGRPMEGSLLMLRRDDPSAGPEAQSAFGDARAIMEADSSLELALVDLSVLVGADLRYDGVTRGVLRQPADPAGTLYVEVINQGMEFPPDGVTPAHVWLAETVDGRSVTVPDQGEWLLRVVQTRWGDRGSNEEVPLSYGTESTVFLYRKGSAHCRAAEAAIREAIQPIPGTVAGPPEALTVPDIWILVGGPRAGQSP